MVRCARTAHIHTRRGQCSNGRGDMITDPYTQTQTRIPVHILRHPMKQIAACGVASICCNEIRMMNKNEKKKKK